MATSPNAAETEDVVASEIALIIGDYQIAIRPQRTTDDVIDFLNRVNDICDWMKSRERLLFLQGLRTALTNSYWSASRIRMYMRPLLSMTGIDNGSEWVMLALQESESSQLRLVRDIDLRDGLKVSSSFLESHDSYIYVDDAAYTGRTLVKYFQRIANEVSEMSKKQRHLVVWHLTEYSNETMGRLGEHLGRLQNLKVDVTFQRVEDFSSSTSGGGKLGVLFPDSSCAQSTLVEKFFRSNSTLARHKNDPRLWRDPGQEFEDGLFASLEERHVTELALLEVGCWLYIRVKEPVFRPLGFVANRSDVSFGFGSMFATCHNSANTTPIAMWWGDPDAPSYHPFSLWKPLLPRI